MRALALVLTAAAVLLLAAPAARAGGWSLEDYLEEKPRSDWDGYGVGTMTHRRIRQDVVVPGQPGPQRLVHEEKKTLTEITDTECVIKVETLEDGVWTTTEEREPKDKGWKAQVEDKGTETVTVGGKDLSCAKKKVTWTKDGAVQETTVLWIHDTLGIVKMKRRSETEATLVLTEPDATFHVGEMTLKGRVWEMEMTTQGMPLKGKAQMSLDVPENLVRNEMKGGNGSASVDVLMELVAFTKK